MYNKFPVNENKRELHPHGVQEFPVALYTSNNLNLKHIKHHWHEEFELILVISGTFKVNIDFTQIELNKGQSIFINAGRLHSGFGVGIDPCIIQSIVFHPRLIYGDTSSILFQKYIYPLTLKTSLGYSVLLPQSKLLIHLFLQFLMKIILRKNLLIVRI